MKYFLLFIFIIILVGCQPRDSKKLDGTYSKEGVITDLKEIEGTWGLNEYLDSIVLYKSIANYRSEHPAWFSILLQINNDSIKSYGSLQGVEGVIIANGDTIFEYPYTETGKWLLIRNRGTLILKQSPNQEYFDSTTYTLGRRDDLKYMIHDLEYNAKEMRIPYELGKRLTKYFNRNILSGEYKISNTNRSVAFTNDGKIVGLDNFTNYDVRDYFGTYHPFQNLDVVYLGNSDKQDAENYNWQFHGDKLTLTEFIRDTINDPEYFILSNNIIELEKTH